MRKVFAFAFTALLVAAASTSAYVGATQDAVKKKESVYAGATLDAVKKKGFIQCGVNTGVPGFSSANDKGKWTGIDVDFCRAVSAAVFGDADKVKYTPLTAKERFTTLQSGEVDILSCNTTWTLIRDTTLGLNFVGVNFYDSQRILVKKSLGVKSALELDGASFCIQAGTTTELDLADYFRAHNMSYTPITFDKSTEAAQAFAAGRCDALTSDRSQLYAMLLQLEEPEGAIILPQIIAKEPLGPVVRQGDDEWFNIARWSLFAMLNAEEGGITSKNIDNLKATSKDPKVRRLLGLEEIKGKGLGLSDDWAYNIIKLVGNYEEVFERNVGQDSPLKIERGLNALWDRGGIQYAPPIR